MAGGQAVTSGQGSVVPSRDKAAIGSAIASGAGTIVADAGAGVAVTGSAATAGPGSIPPAASIILRSRKVGGGAAAYLLGGSGISASQGTQAVVIGRPAAGALMSGAIGSFGKGRSQALSGSVISPASGSLVGQGSPAFVSAVINSAGTTLTVNYSQAVTFGAGGNGGATLGMSGGACTLTYSSGAGLSAIVYNISRVINFGETGTTGYTQPGNGLEAVSGGGDVATFGGSAVTNQSTVGGASSTIVTMLSWNAVPGASSYRIYRGTTSGVHTNNWNVGNVTSYDVNLLTPAMVFGTTYYFAIAAIDAGGEGAKSTQIQVRDWVLI